MTYQYLLALLFYLVFSAFAYIGWPLAKRIFNDFPARYLTAKIFGLVAFSYVIWLLGSLHVLDYQQKTIIFLAFLILCVLIFVYENRNSTPASLKDKLKALAKVEVPCILLYLVYLWIRSNNPAINGTEKFMDMAMLSAAGKTSFFPPTDTWMAGMSINYYYYGHYLLSLLSNITHIGYSYTYNFSLGIIFAASSALSFTLIHKITGSKTFAVLGTFLVIAAGTVSYAGCVANNSIHGLGECYFGKATRLTDPSYIINEYPSYSFTIGDLHAHLIALPLFLTSLLLLWTIFKEPELRKNKWAALALILVATTEGAINTWDIVTITFLTALVCAAKMFWQKQKGLEFWHRLLLPVGIVVSYLVLFVLYWHRMDSQVGGLGFAPTFAKAWSSMFAYLEYPTPASLLLGVWGGFVILGGLFYIFAFKNKDTKKHPLETERRFGFLFFLAALCIVAGTEIFFIKDIYSVSNAPYFRANTVFKFGFHAWTLFAVAFAVGAYVLFQKLRDLQGPLRKWYLRTFKLALAALVLVSLVYPYQGIKQFYPSAQANTLDGADFMNQNSPSDAKTVEWINNNVHERAVLVEASGQDYTYFSRISSFTGMINPINWLTHEWTWRFVYPKMSWQEIVADTKNGTAIETGYAKVAARDNDVREIYISSDAEQTRALLEKYKAQYVYIGPFERETYPLLNEQKFHSLGDVVFQTQDAELFKLR